MEQFSIFILPKHYSGTEDPPHLLCSCCISDCVNVWNMELLVRDPNEFLVVVMPCPWVYVGHGVTLQLSALPSLSEALSFCFRGHNHQLVSLLYISNPLVASWVSLPLFYPLRAVSSEGELVSFLKHHSCFLYSIAEASSVCCYSCFCTRP